MKIKKLIYSAIVTLSSLSISSCNFLNVDDYFVDTFQVDSIFTSQTYLEMYLWNIPSYFTDEGAIFGSNYTPGVVASGETFIQWTTSEFPGLSFMMGEISSSSMSNFGYVWANQYLIIRKVNTLIANLDQCADLTTVEKREILGYAYFMRAYAYYNLLVDFGPVVLMGDDVLDSNESVEYYDRARSTYDECVDYICDELETASTYLSLTVTVSQFGRPTRGAAYGLIARLRLMQASPAFNGGTGGNSTTTNNPASKYFGAWKRSTDGEYYVSQTYDESKWAVAAHACKRVMDMNTYSLHTVAIVDNTRPLPSNVSAEAFPNGAGDIDPYESYKQMFSGEAVAFKNPEYLWAETSASLKYYTWHSFDTNTLGGWNGMAVPQNLVDQYYMEDGNDILFSSADYPYQLMDETGAPWKSSGTVIWGSDYGQYTLGGGTEGVYGMYVNREMRFYANIGFSNCYWPCLSCTESDYNKKYITYNYSGTSGRQQTGTNINDWAYTGYVTKKYIHNDDAYNGDDAEVLTKTFPTIRYAEILISYAEALNQLTQTHTVVDGITGDSSTYSRDTEEIASAFNQIRYRCGLPGLTDTELSDAKTLDGIIRREWNNEFFHENRYYYNIRRWGTFETLAAETIYGMNTLDTGDADNYFNVVAVTHQYARYRSTETKLVFLPIPRSEITKTSMLDQNPGY